MPSRTTLAAILLLACFSHAQTFGNDAGISNVSSSACPTQQGAHIIVARASYEPPGFGIIGAVKDKILAQVPGSTAEAVDYPAVIEPNYIESESDGVVAAQKLIRDFVAKCSGSPLVVMGYSQGAHVTADVLAGQDDGGFPDNSTIDMPPPESTLQRVAAAIMMGDPSYTLNETFRVGTAITNGLFVRRNVANFDTTGLAQRMKSYCDAGDPYCAAGKNLTVHLGYVQEYGQQATDFVVEQIQSWYANNTSGTGSNTTSTSPSTPAYTGSASSSRGFSLAGLVPIVMIGAFFAAMI